jgi:hypothetical protein
VVSHWMGDKKFIISSSSVLRKARSAVGPGCVAVVSTHSSFKVSFKLTSGRLPDVKIVAESLSQHDEKHVVPTPLCGIRVGRRRIIMYLKTSCADPT